MAVLLAQMLRFGNQRWDGSSAAYTSMSLILVILWLAFLAQERAYDNRLIGRGIEEYRRIIAATLWLFGGVAVLSTIAGFEVSRGYLAIALPIGLALLLAHRAVQRKSITRARLRNKSTTSIVILGNHVGAVAAAQNITASPELGYVVEALCIPDLPDGHRPMLRVGDHDTPIVRSTDSLTEMLRSVEADAVAITDTDVLSAETMRNLGWSLHEMGVDLIVAPLVTDFIGPRLGRHWSTGTPMLFVDEPHYRGAWSLAKTPIGWLGAVLGVIVLSPIFLTIAGLIKIEDRGPVFYRQLRAGKEGHEFRMWKFRSMVVDADAALPELRERKNDTTAFYKDQDDPRITSIGRFLRATSLDELPQLFNVITGDMSLVGPRPMVIGEGNEYPGFVKRRLLVRPGMTGLWQISGRSDLPEEERVRLDLYYVENFSPLQDLVILAKTFGAVLTRRGAY